MRRLLPLALFLSCAARLPEPPFLAGTAPPRDPFAAFGAIDAAEHEAFAALLSGPSTAERILEASLRAGGVNEPARLAVLQKRARAAWDALAPRLPKAPDRAATGRRLLELLHGGVLRRYEPHQSSVDVLLETGAYNCLSSAIVFAAFARRAGFETGGLEWDSHASAFVVVAGERVPVETTARDGFGRRMSEADHARFVREFSLPRTRLGKAREISDAMLVALVPMNLAGLDGNEATDARSIGRRFQLWSRAALLSPKHPLAIRNRFVLAARLAVGRDPADAFPLLAGLLPLAPDADQASTVRHNVAVIAARRLERAIASGEPGTIGAAVDEPLALLGCPSGPDCEKLGENLEAGAWNGASEAKSQPARAWAAVALLLERLPRLRGTQNHAFFATLEAERRFAASDTTGGDSLLEREWARADCPARRADACPLIANAGTVGTQADSARVLVWARRELASSPSSADAARNFRIALSRGLEDAAARADCERVKRLAREASVELANDVNAALGACAR